MARPRPVPSCRVVKKGSHTEGSTWAGMPAPVSLTSTTISPGAPAPSLAWAASRSLPPLSGVDPHLGQVGRQLELELDAAFAQRLGEGGKQPFHQTIDPLGHGME